MRSIVFCFVVDSRGVSWQPDCVLFANCFQRIWHLKDQLDGVTLFSINEYTVNLSKRKIILECEWLHADFCTFCLF